MAGCATGGANGAKSGARGIFAAMVREHIVSQKTLLRLCMIGISSGNIMSCTLLLVLLWSLVEVHCQQTFPYVSFGLMDYPLANHSYVDLSAVGSAGDNSDSVVCHTDLATCCSGSQGVHRGDWYFPDGTVLPFYGNSVPIGLGRNARIAVIRRTTATGPTGIYRCDIATNAVHYQDDNSVRESVYVGLYYDGGIHNGSVDHFISYLMS